MNTVLIGLRAKNLASYFQVTFDISRLTISHTSCAWAAMRLFLIATCYHKADSKKAFLLHAPFLLSFLDVSSLLAIHVCCDSWFFVWHLSALGFSLSWPSVIPVLPVSPRLEHRWASHVVIPVTKANLTAMLHRLVQDLNRVVSLTMWPYFPFQGSIIVAVQRITGIRHPPSLCPCLILLPIRLQSSPLVKKLTHSKRRSNNSIERSILTSSQRSALLKRESAASWWRK